MSFVNEYISEADIERFDLRKSDRKYGLSQLALHWTIDRDSGIYLRRLASDKEVPNRELFEFFFDAKADQVLLDLKFERNPATNEISLTWSFVRRVVSGGNVISSHYLAALESALVEYRYRGLNTEPGVYDVKFVSDKGAANV